MNIADYMKKLKEDIGVAVFSTIDENQQPDSRYINIGMANDSGVFFMTNRKTRFHQQLTARPEVAISGMTRENSDIEVIRIKGKVRAIGREKLVEILQDNPYVKDVYPEQKDREDIQVYQVYQGSGKYHHLQKRIQSDFTFGDN